MTDVFRKEDAVPNIAQRFRKLGYVFREFWAFMRIRKKWWLAPILLIMLMFGLLIVVTQGSALAPFIYTVF